MTQEMLDLFSGLVPDNPRPEPSPDRPKRSKPGTKKRLSNTPAGSPPPDSGIAEHKLKPPKPSTDVDLRAGALRLVLAITDSSPGARERVTVKVRLPADVLAAARAKSDEAKVPGPTGGRPSVAGVLADLLDRVLAGERIENLLAALADDLGTRAGGVNVTVDSAGYVLLAASAKQLGITTPELIARVLTLGLRSQKVLAPTRRPRMLPGLREAAEAAVDSQTTVVLAQAYLPNVDLSRVKDVASAEAADRPRMIGRLLTAGLDASDRDPLPVLTALTDPQTMVPPATTRARIRVEKGTWLTILGLSQTLDRGVDDVASALLQAGLDAHDRRTGAPR